MKFAAFAVTALLLAAASPAAAEVAGPWHVSGRVASFTFTLNCVFKPEGASLGGVCTDASTNDPKVNAGKSHVLTSGSVDGDKVAWTYQSSFLFTKFDVSYSGVQAGDRIAGTIRVQGRDGTFTATRP